MKAAIRAGTRSALFVCNDASYFLAHRAHLARRLVADEWNVRVLSGGADEIAANEAIDRLTVDRKRFSPLHDVLLFLGVLSAVLLHRFSVIHLITMKPIVFGGLACVVGALVRRGGPAQHVATFPGLGRAFVHSGRLSGLRIVTVERTLRLIFARTGMIATFENEADRDHLVARGVVRIERTRVLVGAGLDLDRYATVRADDTLGRFRVLWAARFIRGKGLHLFVEAARRAGNSDLDIEFVVAGYGDAGHPDNLTSAELQDLCGDSCVTFLGRVDDMVGLLQETDALVLPSSYVEGLPRILIEAAAAGVPTIASDQAGCRRVTVPGETGLLLPRLDAEAVLRAVCELADDRGAARRMGLRARDLVRRGGFDQRQVQDAFIACYG